MCAPARTSAGRRTGRSVGTTMARSSVPWRVSNDTARPMKKQTVSVESARGVKSRCQSR